MSKEIIETSELMCSNGWQNVGICMQFAMEKIPRQVRLLYLEIVNESFGYRKHYTQRRTQDSWAKMLGMSKPTFNAQINKLLELKFIKINKSSSFVEGGGSEAFSYSPAFPKGCGAIIFEEAQPTKKATKKVDAKKEWDCRNMDF